MPELPSFPTNQKNNIDLSLEELSAAYAVLRNHVRVNESTKYKPGSNALFSMLRVKSMVRKLEAALDAQAIQQPKTDAKSSES